MVTIEMQNITGFPPGDFPFHDPSDNQHDIPSHTEGRVWIISNVNTQKINANHFKCKT